MKIETKPVVRDFTVTLTMSYSELVAMYNHLRDADNAGGPLRDLEEALADTLEKLP